MPSPAPAPSTKPKRKSAAAKTARLAKEKPPTKTKKAASRRPATKKTTATKQAAAAKKTTAAKQAAAAKETAAKESEPDPSGGAHAFWSGTITFGLVSVPVELVPSTSAGDRVAMRMLSDEGAPLRREYVCARDDVPVPWDELVRGFPLPDGSFVPMTDEELESIAPEKSRDIELSQFVDRDAIDPALFLRGYTMAARGDSTRAYRLLVDAMETGKKAGIATFVLREKQHPVAIFAQDGVLRAQTLRHADELRAPDEVGLPASPHVDAAEVAHFVRYIAAHASDELPSSELEGAELQEIRDLARAKLERGQDVVEVSEPALDDDVSESLGETDVVEVLKRRLSRARTG